MEILHIRQALLPHVGALFSSSVLTLTRFSEVEVLRKSWNDAEFKLDSGDVREALLAAQHSRLF